MRDDFSINVKRVLAARVAFQCSRPECGAVTSGPTSDKTKSLNVGVAAHITAASPGGPRYCKTLSRAERQSIENAIWLCQNCAKLIDNDPSAFGTSMLREWKAQAEKRALFAVGRTDGSASSRFILRTLRMQNTAFLYTSEPWPFPADPSGEDAMHPLNPLVDRSSYTTEYPVDDDFPRIPSGNLTIDITLENHAESLILVNAATVEVLEVFPLPRTARMNWYRPELDPHLFEVEIVPKVGKYPIFTHRTFKYGPREADLFRIAIQLKQQNIPKIVRFKVVVSTICESVTQTLSSDRQYLIGPCIDPSPAEVERRRALQVQTLDTALELSDAPRFNEVVAAIKAGDFHAAEALLNERISYLSTVSSLKKWAIMDGQPPLADCLTLRAFVRLFLEKTADAVEDLCAMMKIGGSQPEHEDLKHKAESIRQQLQEMGEGAKDFILRMAIAMKEEWTSVGR